MTNPVGLHLVWAASGGVTDPTDIKYQQGWIAEIPTYQNFNFVLQGLDKAKLAYAESDVYPWQDFIAYSTGARVRRNNRIYQCITAHNDSNGSNPRDPSTDTTNSYWVSGVVFSSKANPFENLHTKEGIKFDEVNTRTSTNLWESNDVTISNNNNVIALNCLGATHDNLLLTNARGILAVVNVGNTTDPDSQSLLPSANANSHAIYHEGNKPTQSDVSGTIPDAPSDGNAHGRKNGNWVVVESENAELIAASHTDADFLALAEKRMRDDSCSGFKEMGRHHTDTTNFPNINQGMWQNDDLENLLMVAAPWSSTSAGESRTLAGIAHVNGVAHTIQNINVSNQYRNYILFPPAPNGTKTFNAVTGEVLSHASSAIAFATETSDIKVIVNRNDLVLLESFHEAIDDKDIVYPLGNTHFGSGMWEGVSLSSSLVAQSYSSFGTWDTVTKGYGARWSTLPHANKLKFLQDPKNNIYYDSGTGQWIQVRYRIRVIEGHGSNWQSTDPQGNYLRYDGANHVQAQGALLTPSYGDLATYNASRVYHGKAGAYPEQWSLGLFSARENTTFAHKGRGFIMPIADVERENQGAYHPEYNPRGCRQWRRSNVGANVWGNSLFDAYRGEMSPAAAFVESSTVSTIGYYDSSGGILDGLSGRPYYDPFPYYDAIYAGKVNDRRIDANKKTIPELLAEKAKESENGSLRSKDSLSFTKAINTGNQPATLMFNGGYVVTNTEFVAGDSIDVYDITTGNILLREAIVTNVNSDGNGDFIQWGNDPQIQLTVGQELYFVRERRLVGEYETLPHQDIIANNPARIKATFPSGVLGKWVSQTSFPYDLNRPVHLEGTRDYTTDDGATWTSSFNMGTFDLTKNQVSDNYTSSHVSLIQYTAKADYYEPANNSKVLGELGGVFVTESPIREAGNALMFGLIGKVGTSTKGAGDGNVTSSSYPVTAYRLADDGSGKLHSTSPIFHEDLMLNTSPRNSSPSMKAVPYITEDNHQLYLQYMFEELVFGNGFILSGDDSKFLAVNGVGETYNLYGEVVRYGQRRIPLLNLNGKGE